MPVVSDPSIDIEERDEDQLDPTGPRIRCPLCGWTPSASDRWVCTCGHVWNTFDTGGVCPACLYQWTETCCLQCHKWSPHSDWYAQDCLLNGLAYIFKRANSRSTLNDDDATCPGSWPWIFTGVATLEVIL